MSVADSLAPGGAGAALAKASTAVSAADKSISANRAGMQTALADYSADKARIDQKEAALGDVPKLDALPKAPERQESDPGKAFGSAAMALAVLGSTLTRQHLTAALNGATGVINAYKQHDAEEADRKFQEWKVNTDNALKLHQYAMESYKTSLDKLRDDRTGATAELNAKFKAFGDDNAAAVLQEQGAEGLTRLFMERQRLDNEISRTQTELGDKHRSLQKLFEYQDALEKARDTNDVEGARRAQQHIQDWQAGQPGGIRALGANTPLAKFIQMRADEAAAAGESWTADKEKAAVAEFNKDTAKPTATSNIKSIELNTWLKEQTDANGHPPTSAEIEAHRKEMDQAKPSISVESAKRRAEMVIAGDSSAAAQGMGRGNAATANNALVDDQLTKLAQERGLSGADLAARQAEFRGATSAFRSIDTREANIEQGRFEVERLAPQVREASANVPRKNYPDLNAIIAAGREATGNPQLRIFALKLQALKSAYTQVLLRGGAGTDTARARSDELFSTKDPERVIEAALKAVNEEGQAVAGSMEDTRAELSGRITGRSPVAKAPPEPGTIVQGHRFKGGNPADPNSWEAVP